MANTGEARGIYSKLDIDLTVSAKAPSLRLQDEVPRKKSWRAPIIIVLTLMAGLALSLTHHFIYKSLDGRPVDRVSFSQAWVSHLGTALAFLVKMCFMMSVGAAFVQHQWLRLHDQAFELKEVDALTGILGNAMSFFDSSVWLRHRVLAVLAIVSWTIPLSAVVTPGSLTVAPLQVNETSQYLPVPLPSFSIPGVTNPAYGSCDATGCSSNKDIYRILLMAASSSQPVPMLWDESLFNASYTLDFSAPAVRCQAADFQTSQNISYYFNSSTYAGGRAYAYAAWTNPSDIFLSFNKTSTQSWATLDETSSDASHIYVMSNYVPNTQIVNVTDCALWNATYSVNFEFQYLNPTLDISVSKWLNPVVSATQQIQDSTPAQTQYFLMMDAFGQLLIGYSYNDIASNTPMSSTRADVTTIDWSRAETVQAGLMGLFQNFVLSLLSNEDLTYKSPRQVAVTTQTYVYRSFGLLLAYGLAFLATFLCACLGLRAFFVNNASYQNIFSSFLRASNGLDEGYPGDTGADPLPKGLGRKEIRLLGRRL